MMKLPITLAAVALAMLTYGNAEMLRIADRWKESDYRIVLPENALASEKYAAEELRKYVEKMTDVKLPANGKYAIRFERGDSDLGEDGFHICARGTDLVISGGKRGVIYGVYELLENYGGCGWFSPEREVVPKRSNFTIPADIDVKQKPAFEMREALWAVAYMDPNYACRLRINGNSPALSERHGGKSHRFGGGLGNCHTFQKLVPVEVYGKTHPEYFAMRNGKRIVTSAPQYSMQLCLSNPDVFKIVVSNVLEAIRRDPTAKYYGVSQNDNDQYCQCEKCAAVDAEEGSTAGMQMRFVNAVAEEVEKVYPEKIIETLAYHYTRHPPKKTKLRKNVMPCLCTIECDFNHPLATGKAVANRNFMKDISGWAAQTERLYVWDYTVNFNHYVGVFPNFDVLQKNIQLFRDSGVTSLFEQGQHMIERGADFGELKTWLIAKWMWNPDLPEGPLLRKFFAGYYGKAAPYVRQYFDRLRRMERPDGVFNMKCGIEMTDPLLVTDEILKEGRALFDKAIEAAKHDEPVVLTNVLRSALSVDYTMFSKMAATGGVQPEFTARRTPPNPELQKAYVEAAKRIRAMLQMDKRISFCEDRGKNAAMKKMIDEVCNMQDKPFVPSDKAIIEGEDFGLLGMGAWCRKEDDPTASKGVSVRLFNDTCHWCMQKKIPGGAFDDGVTYRMRVKAKFMMKENAPDELMMAAGIYNLDEKKGILAREFKKSSVDKYGEWVWLDVGTFKPAALPYAWICCGRFGKGYAENPCVKAIYIDQVEFSRAE